MIALISVKYLFFISVYILLLSDLEIFYQEILIYISLSMFYAIAQVAILLCKLGEM